MNDKLSGLLKKKPVLVTAAAVIVLILAVGIAALLGVFGGNGARDTGSDVTVGNETVSNPEGTLKFMDSAVTITADETDSLGVSVTSVFRLLFNEAPDEKLLASSLSVEPSQAFELRKVSAREYSMEFKSPLQSDSIYSFVISDNNTGAKQSWAFQTKKAFNVIRTLPRNKSVQVPVNTGIEITFSHENAQDVEKFFEISPEVTGRFEWHKKTLVFVPDKLEQSTVYTVTIKKGLGVSGSSESLKEDYAFSFQTAVPENNRRTYFDFSDSLYTVTPQSTPALQVYVQDSLADSEIDLELYSYPDADSFLKDLKSVSQDTAPWYISDKSRAVYDESKLQKAATVKGHIARFINSYWQTNYLVLPSSLQEGYYLVAATVDGEKYYAQLQVNTASVYIMRTEEKSLAWLNDSITGKPLPGAKFSLDTGTPAISDSDGMAVLNERVTDDTSVFYLIKPAAGLTYVAKVVNNYYQPYYGNYYGSDITDNYWTYMYLDRDMFLPEDTVNIWGMLKPRGGGSGETEAVLELIRYSWYSNGDNNASVLSSQNVKLSPNGTFTGSLEIDGYNPGSYEVQLKVGGKVMVTRYLQVMEYTKPVLKLEVEKDREYMYAWDTVKFDFLTSFYEGTPVSGIELSYSTSISGGDTKNGVLTSDEKGAAGLAVQPSTAESGWRPVSLNLNVGNYEAEEQQVQQYCYVTVFPKDTMIEMDSEVEDKTAKLNFRTSRIDLSRLSGENASYYQEDAYRGASVDMPLSVKLYERYYEKKKTGNYYDYINKVTRDTYEYYEVKKLINEYGFSTVNGLYELSFTAENEKNYHVEITGADSQGRPIKETRYIYNWNYYDPYNNRAYILTDDDMDHLRKLDEAVSLEVKYNREQTGGNGSDDNAPDHNAPGNRRYLFIRLKNGVLDYRLSGDPTYSFGYKNELIPNMYVKAVCFDGKGVYDAGIQEYTYDSSEKNLDINVKQDRESYKPGDNVRLVFEVKDQNGKPRSSELNVSVVDEAFFAMSQQNVDILSSLYGPRVSSGIIADYFSYISPEDMTNSPMAEMGEGGDASVRKDFRDSALFTTVTTGSDGKAEASFKLPDNLTSWRVTYQAVTEDLHAGSGRINISSKLPFFADTIFNKAFITGDSPSILLRAYGTELASNAEVDYKVTLTKEDGSVKEFSSKGVAHEPTYVSLGSLAAGEYTIKTEAAAGNLKDALERTFRVSDSLLETSLTDYSDLTDNTAISNNAKGLTSLVFYGEDSAMLYNELRQLYWSWGRRLDQKLAEQVAAKLLANYFNERSYSDEEFDIRQYQTDDGGLALLTYDSSNPALSAKMSSLAADYIDRDALATYFKELLQEEETPAEDAAYCYWGLAALKEPVLLDIRSILDSGGMTAGNRLILGAALAEIGDYSGAREIYTEMMKASGKITETFAWAETGTRDESIESTALLSLIALKINAPEKIKLFSYIKSNSTSELLVNLERMIFVTNYIKQASLSSSFSYELDGVKKQVELQKGGYFRMDLTPEKLAALKFSDVQGKIKVSASYAAPISEVRKTEGNLITLERVYSTRKKAGPVTAFDRSDTIRITITPSFSQTAPDGYYEVTDVLPAGFRYSGADYAGADGNNWWYPDEVAGQKVVFGYYYNKKDYQKKSITYYARAVTPGGFTADNAAIRHTDSDIADFTEKQQVTVNK